jgi:Flp pilus assembly secretin CpaC
MTAFFACCSYRPRLFFASGILLIAAIACALQHQALAADTMPVPSVGAQVIVHVDQAKVLKLPERTATLVVGNPLIADATVQPGGIIVITAKSYGVTNLIALDRTGTTLMEHRIRVLGPTDNVVVLYRGIERESYSCMPNCERRISLGDTPNYFMTTLSQTGNVNTLAQGRQQK